AQELVAHGRSVEEIARLIKVDGLIYQDLGDLEEAVRRGNPHLQRFESSCFSGEYVTADIDSKYLSALEQQRADAAKTEKRARADASNVVGLHNAS
ncbi:MAG: amidophosphoribosyltransferase, partial [Candidatus Competibacteraceae bacterium]|nr:amidophosphoribosyltransferase [Candidatus Competibacteraceae bacterium]